MRHPEVRDQRLMREFERLQALRAESDHFHLDNLSGSNRPDLYRITFDCHGFTGIDSQRQPIASNQHVIILRLGANFPSDKPDIRTFGRIWHPNIQYAEQGLVCINDWVPLRKLDEVVEQVYNLIRFDPRVTNPDSPYNLEAADWYRKQRSGMFPLDPRPLRSGKIQMEFADENSGNGEPVIVFAADPPQGDIMTFDDMAPVQAVVHQSTQPAEDAPPAPATEETETLTSPQALGHSSEASEHQELAELIIQLENPVPVAADATIAVTDRSNPSTPSAAPTLTVPMGSSLQHDRSQLENVDDVLIIEA